MHIPVILCLRGSGTITRLRVFGGAGHPGDVCLAPTETECRPIATTRETRKACFSPL